MEPRLLDPARAAVRRIGGDDQFLVSARSFASRGNGRARRRAWAYRDRDRRSQLARRLVRAHIFARENARPWRARGSFPARGSSSSTAPRFLAYPKDRAAYGRLCRILPRATRVRPKANAGSCSMTFWTAAKASGRCAASFPKRRWRERLSLTARQGDSTIRRWRERCRRAFCARPSASVYGSARASTYGADMRGGWRGALRSPARSARRLIATNDALMHRRAARARRRPHLHPRENHARGRGAPHASQRRAPSQSSTRNGAAFRRGAGGRRETIRFLDGLAFSLDELRHCYPEELREGYATAQAALEAFAWKGAETRYPEGIPERTREALDV